jgi:hypothetical protein
VIWATGSAVCAVPCDKDAGTCGSTAGCGQVTGGCLGHYGACALP